MIDANVSKEKYFSRRVDWEEPVYVGYNNAKNYATKRAQWREPKTNKGPIEVKPTENVKKNNPQSFLGISHVQIDSLLSDKLHDHSYE